MKILIFILFLIISNQAISQEYLEPETGIFSTYQFQNEYYSLVKKYLTNDLSEQPLARAIVIPSFTNEYVVTVESDSLGYIILFRTLYKSIYQENIKGKSLENIDKIEYKNRIDKELAEQLHEIFYISVSQARFSKPEYYIRNGKRFRNASIKGDGENYYLSSFEHGIRSAKTWSPNEGTRMSKIVKIVELMKAYSYDTKYGNELKINVQNYLQIITND